MHYLLGSFCRKRRLNDPGLDILWSDDFEDFEVLQAGDLTMRDARVLAIAVALLDAPDSLPFIFELGPAVQHHGEPEGAVMDMPVLYVVIHFLAVRLEDVGNMVAPGRRLDTGIPVFEDLAQIFGPDGLRSLVVFKFPVVGHGVVGSMLRTILQPAHRNVTRAGASWY